MPEKIPTPKDIQLTKNDLFIIESLKVEDEINERFEGKLLQQGLKISGMHPYYCYVRTAQEFNQAIELFLHSQYRYLHLSCHGSPNGIFTTLDFLPNAELSENLTSKLKNRRLFVSACEVGSGILNLLVQGKNHGMYSMISPIDSIRFDVAYAFWIAFYTKLYSVDKEGMSIDEIKKAVNQLTQFFGVRFSLSYFNPQASVKNWIGIQYPQKPNGLT